MKKTTEKIYRKALILHKFYRGKLTILPKCPVRKLSDFNYWYTPGVAAVSIKISKDKDKVFEYTNRWNFVGIISDGSRVLGLGDVGANAAIPVMEGKALIFKYLGGVDAIPLVLNTKDPKKFIETVENVSSNFGGINLEDIEQPKCFYILDKLKEVLDIPVWHDDQQGTATVTLAALINALKLVNKKISDIKIVLLGAGAANMCIAKFLVLYGATIGNIIMLDSKGILNPEREDIKNNKDLYKEKWYMCVNSNKNRIKGSLEEAIKDADVLIACSKPGPGVVKIQHVRKMSKDAIVFAQANPIPEIWPYEAKKGGAKIVATGRSDFPNQVNNSLCFPGIFRGVLDVQATKITDSMCIEAAIAIAEYAAKKGISDDYIIPTMQDWELYPYIASCVGYKAIKEKVAKKTNFTKKDLYKIAKDIILKSRNIISKFIENKIFLIKMFLVINFLFNLPLFTKEILRYKYFAESLRLDGSCGKIHSINSYTIKKNKVLFGLNRFDIAINYGILKNLEAGVKFNLNDQKDLSNIEKNINLISPYLKYHVIDSYNQEPIDFSLGIYRNSGFLVIEKLLPEFFSTSFLVNFFLSFLENEKFYYNISFSKYTKWVEFILDFSSKSEIYSFGLRALLTPDIRLNLFFIDLKNISDLLFYNFIFGISISI